MMKHTLAGLYLILVAACSPPQAGLYDTDTVLQANLVQGIVSDTRTFASVGELLYPGVSHCSGSFIAPDAVLTAAHCLRYDAGGAPVLPVFNYIDVFGESHSVPVAKVVEHQDYMRCEPRGSFKTLPPGQQAACDRAVARVKPQPAAMTADAWRQVENLAVNEMLQKEPHSAVHDIAIVFLSRCGTGVTPVRLWPPEEEVTPGDLGEQVGYGDLDAGTLHTGMQHWGVAVLEDVPRNPFYFQTNSLAAGSTRRRSLASLAPGDSGGPMFVQVMDHQGELSRIQVGIAARAINWLHTSEPMRGLGLSTRIDHERDWIEAQVQAHEQSGTSQCR